MAESPYLHAELGFGFEMPSGWTLDLASSTHPLFPILLSMRAGSARVMLAARAAAHADPGERASAMKDELAARGIEGRPVAGALHVPGTANVADVEFQIAGETQHWISLVTDGVEFSFTHTGPYADVRNGLAGIAATFRKPAAEQAQRFLSAHTRQAFAPGPEELAGLSHFQRVAARFNVPPAKRPRRGS